MAERLDSDLAFAFNKSDHAIKEPDYTVIHQYLCRQITFLSDKNFSPCYQSMMK